MTSRYQIRKVCPKFVDFCVNYLEAYVWETHSIIKIFSDFIFLIYETINVITKLYEDILVDTISKLSVMEW